MLWWDEVIGRRHEEIISLSHTAACRAAIAVASEALSLIEGLGESVLPLEVGTRLSAVLESCRSADPDYRMSEEESQLNFETIDALWSSSPPGFCGPLLVAMGGIVDLSSGVMNNEMLFDAMSGAYETVMTAFVEGGISVEAEKVTPECRRMISMQEILIAR